jgi:hypothetical protein
MMDEEEIMCSLPTHNEMMMMMDTIDLTYEEEQEENHRSYNINGNPAYQISSNHPILRNQANNNLSITKPREPSNEQPPLEITKIQSLPSQQSPSLPPQPLTLSKLSNKQIKVTEELTIQCPLCYNWFGSHLIESHAAICPAGDPLEDLQSVGVRMLHTPSPPHPPSSTAKEYLNDFADIVISDFSDEKEDEEGDDNVPIVSTLSSTGGKHHHLRKSSSCGSLEDGRWLTDRGDVRFQLLEPLSPIKNFVNLFDLHRQGTRTYQDGTMIFDYLGQFAVDPRKSKSKILEKQQQKVTMPSSSSSTTQKSTGKSSKAKWFAKKRFFAKRK